MYILLADETNSRPSASVTFFIYGGLVLPVDHLSRLDEAIAEIRGNAGYKAEDELKFNTRSRPPHVSKDAHAKAKDEVIAVCLELECRFIAHVIHHGIIKNQNPETQLERAANLVIGRYHEYLNQVADDGICIIDNLPIKKQFQYLSEKFTVGLTIEGGKEIPLPRIKLYASTCINASHANSAMDIVLGAFRYCVNSPQNLKIAKEMMPRVVKLMWHKAVGGVYEVQERGLIVKPGVARLKTDYLFFWPDYQDLFQRMNALLANDEDPDGP